MKNSKNLLITILTGLLALSLFTQPAQSAPKTYDAVKLIQYETCLRFSSEGKGTGEVLNNYANLAMPSLLRDCAFLKP
jgi:hypothetical protein